MTITCHFVAPRPVGSLRLDGFEVPLQGHLLLRLIAVLIPQQLPESSTGLGVGALAAAQAGGTIRLIPGHEHQPAIRRNPPLLLVVEGLLWKSPAKMRKWSAKEQSVRNS